LLGLVDEGLSIVNGPIEIEEHPAIVKCLGDLLVFCFNFDQEKMVKPTIQNDFSFYRRILPRMTGRVTAPIGLFWLVFDNRYVCFGVGVMMCGSERRVCKKK